MRNERGAVLGDCEANACSGAVASLRDSRVIGADSRYWRAGLPLLRPAEWGGSIVGRTPPKEGGMGHPASPHIGQRHAIVGHRPGL